jgi:hypothetical protein
MKIFTQSGGRVSVLAAFSFIYVLAAFRFVSVLVAFRFISAD